jgi:TonB family protein
MNSTLSPSEIRGDRTGKITATIALFLIIVLLFIPVFFFQNPPPGQPGILVNLGLVDIGQGEENAAASRPEPARPEPVEPAPATPPPPPEVTQPEPQPQQRDVVVTEDPAAIELRKRKAREEAERQAAKRERERQEYLKRQAEREEADRQRREREAAEARRKAAEAEQQRREAEAEKLKAGLGGAFGSGNGRGNTGTPGNQGVDDGDPNASRLEGISTGSGTVSGGLGGRGVLASPPVRENRQASGVVVVEVCVNNSGQITKADYTQNGSSTSNPNLVADAIQNAKSWRFAADPMAPATQCGRITYNFKVQ